MIRSIVDTKYLEIAIQTVLHRYKENFELIVSEQSGNLLKQMAGEISRKASKLQSITNSVLKEMEGFDDEL